MNINRTQDFNITMTKVRATHTCKTGFYVNHSYKAQNFGAGGNGAPSFQGALSFAVDTNNPIESGFPFANAALGVYSSYGQQSAFIEGSFLYNNIEWFVQDNWKVNRKLTLDYGVRFVHQQPQYDQFDQVSTFRPETWKLASAPFLYMPGCVGNTATCSGANRVAMDPRTGAVLGPGSSSMVGNVILGSGDGANGLTQADHGIAKTGYLWPALGGGAAIRLRLRLERQADGRLPRIARHVLRPSGRQLGVQHGRQPAGRHQHPVAVGPAADAEQSAVQVRAGADRQLVPVPTRSCRRTSSGTAACRSRCRGRRPSTSSTSATTRTTS